MVDLQKQIPPGTRFAKLISGEPYQCDKWAHDRAGNFCLYYKVGSCRKRAPLAEIEEAAQCLASKNKFDRADFSNVCPIANRDGPCGFAVIGRILEKYHGAKYTGRGRFEF